MDTESTRPDTPAASTNYEQWWSTDVHLWWRDFDYLGHVTAASYGSFYEEAFGRFAAEAWGTEYPSYVVATMSISYLREIVRDVRVVRVYVDVTRIGRSGVIARLVAVDTDGRVCSTADNRYVAWNREARAPRPLADLEREGLRKLAHSLPST